MPSPLPSMATVAALAGVSHQTVSRVLNDSPLVRPETRERVLAAVDRLGYRRNAAARALARNRSGRIGMVSAHLSLHGPSMIAVAVQEAGHAAGYDVSLVAVPDVAPGPLRAAVDRLLDERVEAIVVAIAHRDALDSTRALDLSVPLVLVQGVSAGQPMAVGIDQVHGAAIATEHLLDLGHRNVAHVTGPLSWVEARQRRAGWTLAHERRGLFPGPELGGDWSASSGYEAGRVLADETGVSAVFAANDAMALGLLRALHESGRSTPADVSVVGFDDASDAAYYWPPLTTVRQDFSGLGQRAVALGLQAIDGSASPSAELILPTLTVRSSTSAPA